MDGEEYNKKFQYINEGTYSIEDKNTLNIRCIHKFYILTQDLGFIYVSSEGRVGC
jgi:hypothetical protein